MISTSTRRGLVLALFVHCGAISVETARAASAAPVLTTLVSFNGSNGSIPVADVTFDCAGNLYGTTLFGGSGGEFGYGTVFELSGQNHNVFQTIVSFDSSNGSGPGTALTLDARDDLYGTTEAGGAGGSGTAFRLSGARSRKLTTLASFAGANGATPRGGLALYSPRQFHLPGFPYYSGHLFGTTSAGGASGDGTVFKLSGKGHDTQTVLISFAVANGSQPGSTLVADAGGHLYGTTFTGGPGSYGTVFELSDPDHRTLTTLAAFNGENGANPVGGLIVDAQGDLYGTTQYGGQGGGGTIFELSGPRHRKLSTLATFGSNDPNGAVPQGTLLLDAAGNLYGTTNGGGDEFGGAFLGTVFKLSFDHKTMTPLYAFTGGLDGDIPQAGLVADAAGNLYGTTTSGGADGGGTVFEVSGSGFVTNAGLSALRQ
jgi:uncharacterized repeat protein (TIGR03803 family)